MNYFARLTGEDRKSPTPSEDGLILDQSKVFKLLTSDSGKLCIEAVAYSNTNNYLKAIETINQAIQLDQTNHHFYNVRASIKENYGDYEGAVLDYIVGLDISHNDSYATYHQIGINCIKINQRPTALEAFDIAIELKNKIIKNVYNESQMPYVIDGVAIKVDYEKIYNNRATAKFGLGDFQGSMEDCNLAIKENPKYSNSYLLIGIIFTKLGQKDNALNALSKAQKLGNSKALGFIQKIQTKE